MQLFAARPAEWEPLGPQRSSAAGECVDKVAKMFGHPMPGGPVVDGYAMQFSGEDFEFPKPLLKQKGFDFSFSGLKTAMLRFRQQNPDQGAAYWFENQRNLRYFVRGESLA